jgi:hypothetical protein
VIVIALWSFYELSDDSKFLAIVDTKLYRELEGLTYASEQSSLVEQNKLFGSFDSKEFQQYAIARNKAQNEFTYTSNYAWIFTDVSLGRMTIHPYIKFKQL